MREEDSLIMSMFTMAGQAGCNALARWAEYCAKCEAEHTIPYQHSQFNDKYHAYAASKENNSQN